MLQIQTVFSLFRGVCKQGASIVCMPGIVAILFFAGCSGLLPTNQNKNNNTIVVPIAIRGTLAKPLAAKRGQTPGDSIAVLLAAKKVLVCQGNNYSLVTIVNGSFTATAAKGAATALVFLDSNNNYIGNLCASGLNMLPLRNLKNGDSTTIDLSTLTLSGTSVVPAHNPLGDEILVTESEIAMMKELGGYYEALAKNIDADNDGIPDVLSDRQLLINTMFIVNGGKFGKDSVAPIPVDTADRYINYSVRISGNKPLIPINQNVTMSGPVESPYNDISFGGYAQLDGFLAFFKRDTVMVPGSPLGSNLLPFKKGTYTITLNGTNNYTLNYSNINAKYYLVKAAPTLHTNSAGKLVSISVTYTLSDGSSIDPTSFITNLQFILQGSSGILAQYGSMYESIPTSNTITNFRDYMLPTPLDISLLQGVSVNYNDLLGNEYNTTWQ
jgi:hypothetical protein